MRLICKYACSTCSSEGAQDKVTVLTAVTRDKGASELISTRVEIGTTKMTRTTITLQKVSRQGLDSKRSYTAKAPTPPTVVMEQ